MAKRKLALITGATSGIGAAFARKLATLGYDLVLHGRRKEKLNNLAQELRQTGVEAEVLIAELASPAGMQLVEKRIRAADNLFMLVNNAGFTNKGGGFSERDVDREEELIRVHATATMRFTSAALPQMLSRGEGDIINVSSVAAFLPSPSGGLYHSTKAFINAFTRCLHLDLDGTGLRVQALCPGFTHTDFHSRIDMDPKQIAGFLWMTSEKVVDLSLKALPKGKPIYISGLRNKLIVWLFRATPGFLKRRILLRGVAMRDKMNKK